MKILKIFWLLVALAWGTLRILEIRNKITDSDFEDQSKDEENTLTFSQWIAFLLLIVSVYSMVETWYGKSLIQSYYPVSLLTICRADAKLQKHDDERLELQPLIDTAEHIYESLDNPRN